MDMGRNSWGLELFTSENDSAPRIFYRENGLSNNFIQGIIEDKGYRSCLRL